MNHRYQSNGRRTCWFLTQQINCHRCKQWIKPLELVFRIPYGHHPHHHHGDNYYLHQPNNPKYLYYHLNCFTCTDCSHQLRKGELYGLIIDDEANIGGNIRVNIYCERHFHMAKSSTQAEIHKNQITNETPKNSGENQCYFNGQNSIEFKETLLNCDQRQQQQNHGESWANDNSLNDNHSNNSQSNQTKRMRTSFKKCQIDLLQKYFKHTHKPTAVEMCKLVNQTKLSKRVLQIWFQNQRSKWSKLMIISKPPIVGPIKANDTIIAAELFAKTITIIEREQINHLQ